MVVRHKTTPGRAPPQFAAVAARDPRHADWFQPIRSDAYDRAMRKLLMLTAIGACGDDGGIAPDAGGVLDAPADAPTPQKQATVAVLQDKPSNMTLWLGAFG